SNADLVEKAARMARDVGREPATPDEAREIMGMD
ncbi:MAG: 3-keto-5-aminohexanoate cleavage protein, partial [Halobacteria archaeon]|nr:3-keto-5-aminohexanoate cleavage protein [Halobacteria archaeon]